MAGQENTPSGLQRSWLLVTNFSIMYRWAFVLRLLLRNYKAASTPTNAFCPETLVPAVYIALTFSFLELLNALLGVTKSKPHQVLLFSIVRFGVEKFVAPLIPCSAWQHLLTITTWSLGDTIRFGCFVLDVLVPGGQVAKSIRYTAGPVFFPIGALGEMLMVIKAAKHGRWYMYLVALLWPVGFYPLMKQLLKQRRKFFNKDREKKKEIKSI